MDKIWNRGVTKYLQTKGLAPKDIHADMVATLGDDVPALSNGGQLNSRAVGWALKMTDDPDVLPQPPPKKTSTVFTTMVMDDRRLSVNQV